MLKAAILTRSLGQSDEAHLDLRRKSQKASGVTASWGKRNPTPTTAMGSIARAMAALVETSRASGSGPGKLMVQRVGRTLYKDCLVAYHSRQAEHTGDTVCSAVLCCAVQCRQAGRQTGRQEGVANDNSETSY